MLRIIIAIITAALFSYGTAIQYKSCQELPKIDVTDEVIKTLITNGPTNYNFATPTLRCSALVFTNSTRGDPNDSFFSLLINRATTTILKAFVDSSNKKNMNAIVCQSGVKQIWHFTEVTDDNAGTFVCPYTCDNEAIKEFGCASNSRTAFLDKEAAFVKEIQTIPNANLVEASDQTCFENKNCPTFA